MTQTAKQKFTLPLIAVLIGILVIITGFLIFNRLISKPVEITDIKIDADSALKLNVLKQISKKNGITEWELEAASATLMKREDKAVLKDVHVTFYTKENKRVTLTSNQGVLNTKSHDMTLSGNVITKYDEAVLRTETLHYNKKEHIIHTDSHVKLEKRDSVIEADSMVTRLNEDVTVLTGQVRGLFSESFNIR